MPRCVLASTECDGCRECFEEKNTFFYNYFDDKENNDGNSCLQDLQEDIRNEI